jgi:peptidoglycan glycosyltransferase
MTPRPGTARRVPSRRTEPILLAAAAFLAAGGTLIVDLAADEPTVEPLASLLVFAAAFFGLRVAVHRWAFDAVAPLLAPAALLTAIGWVEVYRIDADLGRLQRWWLLAAAVIAAIALRLLDVAGVQVLRRYRFLFFGGALVLLLLPLLPSSWPVRGAIVNGARLWVRVDLGAASLSFQPGEAAKLLVVVFLAAFLADRRQALTEATRRLGPFRLPEPRQLVPIGIAFGVALAVLVYQRDLGASLLLLVVFAGMLYMATGRRTYPLATLGFVGLGAVGAPRLFSHVQVRVDAWLQPWADPSGGGYQMTQALFALGSGGLTGSGIGGGSPGVVPAAATDYVFVAIGEEMGLIGSLLVIGLFGLLIAAGFGIALRATDTFRSLLAAGLSLALGAQAIIILAGVLRVLPVTGITLPFMSYGGSALLANFVSIALLMRISHEERS